MKKIIQNTFIALGFLLISNMVYSQILSEDFSSGVFPPLNWTLTGDGETNWSANSSSNAGGDSPEARFNYAPAFVGESRLESPVIATSGLTEVGLNFKHFLDDFGAGDLFTLYVETTSDGGLTWNVVWSLIEPGANVGPETVNLIISNADVGSDQFQIAFRFEGDSYQLDYWYIDNVNIIELLDLDAEALSMDYASLVGVGTDVNPVGTVSNNGVSTITFDGSFVISSAGSPIYEESIAATDLAPNETLELNFPAWTSTEGDFDVVFYTNLVGDENQSNDTLYGTLSAAVGLIFLKPLYEEFTSATCGPCAGGNAILDPVLEDNESTHSAIKYQVDWPGDGDPYYTDETGVRIDYYSVSFAPDLRINSEYFDLYNMTQTVYDEYLPLTTAMELEVVSAEIDENYVVSVTVDIDVIANYAAGLTAHIAIVEKTTVGNVMGNGETEFYNVMMKMLPDAGGTTLPALTEGVTETLTYSYDMSSTFMEGPNDLMVVVFVQNDSDMSIIQSEHAEVEGEFETYTITMNVDDSDGDNVVGAEIFLESYGTKYTDANGQAVYTGVFPGTFNYDVSAAGLFPTTGTVEMISENVVEDIVLEVPDYYYFEDFANEIPLDWTLYFSGWDYLYYYDGEIIFFRQSQTLNPLLLVSPPLDVSTAGSIIFSLGSASGDPEVLFGTISDPLDPETFESVLSVYPGSEYEEFVYDLADFTGGTEDVYFSWKHNISETSFFSLTYVIITAGAIDNIDENILRNVQVYPNPSTDFFNIRMEMKMNSISIYSSMGQLIKSIDVNTTDYKMNVSDYAPGMYLLKIETDKGQIIKSITLE